MTAPLSNVLRESVVGAIETGESCRSVAARFGVAVSSAVKWHQRYRLRAVAMRTVIWRTESV